MLCALLFLGVARPPALSAAGAVPRIFLAGDSTVASYGTNQFPLAGWGQMLPLMFTNLVVIKNHAFPGTTARSFVEGGYWKKICDQLQPDDYVLVQFGRNDQASTDLAAYSNNLARLVGDVRRAKAVPVLVVPPNCGDFAGDRAVDYYEKYDVMVRQVASASGVGCLDLQARSMALFDKLGKEETLKDIFMCFPAGAYPNYPAGKKDTWHFSEDGARRIAELVAAELQSQHSPLACYLMRQNFTQSPAIEVQTPPQAGAANVSGLKLPAIFTDNLVLQQNQAVPVWGWNTPGAEVTVKFGGQTKTTRAGVDGKWLVKLDELTATAEPQTLVIESGETKVFRNIVVGEVWLCSGQSNMVKPLGSTTPDQKPVFNFERELANAAYPNIRFFRAWETKSAVLCQDFKAHSTSPWLACSPSSLDSQKFSAVAYFFGREIHTNLNVPVGLIESAWGGTPIEPWIAPEGFEAVASLTNIALPASGANEAGLSPSVIYNDMIAPMAGYAIRGALWYQGEGNVREGFETYLDKMRALVGGWRKVWKEGDFPFYFVQLAPYGWYAKPPNGPEILPQFWELQSQAAQRIKNTGLAVTTDLVDDLHDIHPRNKQAVGHRLALLALNKTYGKTNVVCSGPRFRRLEIVGDKAVLDFDGTDGGLISKDGQPLTWFTIAGGDGAFVPATARIVGDRLEISAATVKTPVAVRFAWAQTAQPNFFNRAGLPAEPFRTDAPGRF